MGVYAGPDVSESGLVLALDGANYKSFKGSAATNILVGISPNQADQNSALYKVVNGNETVYIPSIGYVNSKYVDFYNDYNGGSGACCPNLFSYGTGLAVSASTTYTYSIIYKTTTGYSHPNYMYRYEYNGSGGYVTESGIHNTSNRTSLGNDWWFAWGQFTTQATTATLNTFMFHYEYATQNRIYVYKAALYSGSHIIPYQYMLDSGQTRGATVATGGGWADMSGNGNNGELANGVRESSDNLGALVFDGTDDYVNLGSFFNYQTFTIELWVNPGTTQTTYADIFDNNHTGNQNFVLQQNANDLNNYAFGVNDGSGSISATGTIILTANTWTHLAFTFSPSTRVIAYVNGAFHSQGNLAGGRTINYASPNLSLGRWSYGNSRFWNGKISNFKTYNRILTASEIQQNFNANRSRFGI